MKYHSAALRRSPLAIVFLLYAAPLLLVLLGALKTNDDITNHPTAVIFRYSLDAFRTVINADLATATLNSLRIAGGATLVCMALGTPLAYVLARLRFRWIGLMLAVLILLQMTPAATSVIPLFAILGALGILGTTFGVSVAIAAHTLPFAVLLMRPFFLSVPQEVDEAAQLDGAGEWRTFLSVCLPLARNGVSVVSVLVFIGAWGDLLYSVSFLNKNNLYPLTVLLTQQQTIYGNLYNNMMALAVIGSIPTIVLFVLIARRLSNGLALGVGK
ncbi:carbohydrate ABC transporter permease [Kribbella sp. NPDC050820]|uniref:carbohydrate ABC transporter permease n=1 Tax=Kribbella sp. NPDC050820 TaxID=3155408 RepID=UPI0033C04435